jgi:ribosomal protein L11 methyltransferase
MAKPLDEFLYRIRFSSASEDLPLVEEILAAHEIAVVAWRRDAQAPTVVLHFFTACTVERDKLRASLHRLFSGILPLLSEPIEELPEDTIRREDWSESWKRFFQAQRVSRRLVLKPSWSEWPNPDADDIILDLDPGMSFGTGRHGTTRACLEILDELALSQPGTPVLDLGCGSGILSLAAWKLGFRPVIAIDHDPDAVRVARENLDRAGAGGVSLSVGDVSAPAPAWRAPIVLANILAAVLIENAPAICSCVSTDRGPGLLVLSGILCEQYEDVKAVYARYGATELESRVRDEWQTGCFQIAHTPT